MTDPLFHRSRSNADERSPTVDVIGLAQAIQRAPRHWGTLISIRDAQAMAETVLMLWQVQIAARGLIETILELDAMQPSATDEVQKSALLNWRADLEAALVEIKHCEKEETTHADAR